MGSLHAAKLLHSTTTKSTSDGSADPRGADALLLQLIHPGIAGFINGFDFTGVSAQNY